MKWALACLTLALGGWLCLAARVVPSKRGASFDDTGMSQALLRWEGAASCSAAACHGATEGKGLKGSEYSTWIDHDAHAHAHSVLFNDRSQRIARNLHLQQPAHESAICLPCHAASPPDGQRGERFQINDGVSCETCHGPAEKWLTQHYLSDWKTKNDAQKLSLGFEPTKNLLARARGCIMCHVGHDDVDVNHDLIAAGHPRLQFEYSSFLAAVPKHWSEREERKRYPDFHSRAWMIGQVTTTQASLDLLAHRTQRIWPEFAEYNCRACHHDLTGESARAEPRGEVGSLRWSDWHAGLVPLAISIQSGASAEPLATALAEIRAEMQKSAPSVDRVRSTAERAKEALRRRAEALELRRSTDPTVLRKSFLELRDDSIIGRRSSESALQQRFALLALYKTLLELGPKDAVPRWRASFDSADLPAGFDKPIAKWLLPE
jgi:hypothetical protein